MHHYNTSWLFSVAYDCIIIFSGVFFGLFVCDLSVNLHLRYLDVGLRLNSRKPYRTESAVSDLWCFPSSLCVYLIDPLNYKRSQISLNIFFLHFHPSLEKAEQYLSAAVLMCIDRYWWVVLWKETASLAPLTPAQGMKDWA